MKYFYLIVFIIVGNKAFSQINNSKIYNTWVVDKITHKDGSELPEEHILKNAYIKIRLAKPNKINMSLTYYEIGSENLFEINDDYLVIKNDIGNLINSYYIENISDTLTLLQAGVNGFNDPSALRYYFIREYDYQKNLKLKPRDVYKVQSGDTIFNSSPKIYATYKDDGGFQRYIYNGIADRINMDNRVGHLAATFTVLKSGIADSVKILEGIDETFNSRFLKVFNQAKKDWKPATLNGKPVAVQMMIDLRYSTSAIAIPVYFTTRKANDAFNIKEYGIALYYYDIALEIDPINKENLYKRGMCKMLLGNVPWACEDWKKAKSLGASAIIDAVLDKYCN